MPDDFTDKVCHICFSQIGSLQIKDKPEENGKFTHVKRAALKIQSISLQMSHSLNLTNYHCLEYMLNSPGRQF